MTLNESIVVVVGGTSSTFSTADSPVRIGREQGEIIVAHPAVSTSHATLEYSKGAWLLTDHSTHGTYVDGARVGQITVDRDLTVWLADPVTGAPIEVRRATASAATESTTPSPVPPTTTPGPGPVLRVDSGAQVFAFVPADAPVTVGRDDHNTVVVAGASISGSHATIEFAQGQWSYRDHSSYGSFVGDEKITEQPLGQRVDIRLAAPDGPALTIGPDEQLGPETIRVSGGVTLPPPTGKVLRITYPPGTTREVAPGTELIVGRGTDTNLQTPETNDLVSRRHARVFFDGKVWRLEDLGSRRGTFVDGVRVKKQKLAGQFDVWLGSPSTGERIVVEAEGTHRRRFSPTVMAGAALVAILLIGGIAFASTRDSGGGGLDNAAGNDVPRMKRATGLVISLAKDGGGSKGSSTVICGDNLVLTNAHVAQPEAPGQGLLYGSADAPATALYLAYPPADDPDGLVEVRYKAEVVAYDGYIDAAALRIVAGASGKYPNIVDGEAIRNPQSLQLPCADLPPVGPLPGKTAVDVFGYPGVTATTDRSKFFDVQQDADSNEITSYTEEVVLEERYGWINLGRNTHQGNSGGLVARNNQIVGMPTRGSSDLDKSQARPIDLARRVIDAARAGKTGDIAAYLTPLTGTEKFSVAPVTATCRLRQLGKADDKAVDFTLSWSSVDPRAHVRIGVSANTKPLYSEHIGRSQEGAGLLGATTCLAFAGVPTDVTDLVVFAGPNYKPLQSFKVKATA